jgi:hypothetical protein
MVVTFGVGPKIKLQVPNIPISNNIIKREF